MTISTVTNLPQSESGRGRSKGEVWEAVQNLEGDNWVMVTDILYPHSVAAYYRKAYGFEVRVIDGTMYVRKER